MCIQDLKPLNFTAKPNSWVLGCLSKVKEIGSTFLYLSFICLYLPLLFLPAFTTFQVEPIKLEKLKRPTVTTCPLPTSSSWQYCCIQKIDTFPSKKKNPIIQHLGCNSGSRQSQGLKQIFPVA